MSELVPCIGTEHLNLLIFGFIFSPSIDNFKKCAFNSRACKISKSSI